MIEANSFFSPDQHVVLGELDPGAAALDEAVADGVAEQRALRGSSRT